MGENRAVHQLQLSGGARVTSINQRPGRSDLRPWNAPLNVSTVPPGQLTIYRMGRDVKSDSNYWLSWPTYVHAVRSFDTGDTSERTFFTGDGEPQATDNIIGLAGAPYPTATRPLGLPAFGCAQLVNHRLGPGLYYV